MSYYRLDNYNNYFNIKKLIFFFLNFLNLNLILLLLFS